MSFYFYLRSSFGLSEDAFSADGGLPFMGVGQGCTAALHQELLQFPQF
jgi:hypothetical protein